MAVLVVTTISTIFILSMDGKVLAQDSDNVVTQPGYLLTVNVPSHPFGTSTIGISITTENGYTDQANIPTAGNPSWTFNIPPNQGNSVQVCVNSGASSDENCNIYKTTGSSMSVSLPAISGSSGNSSVARDSTHNSIGNSDNNKNHHSSSTDNSNDNGGSSNHGQHGTDRHRELGSGNGFNENQGSVHGIGSTGSDTNQEDNHKGIDSGSVGNGDSNSHRNGGSSTNNNNNPGLPMVQFIGPMQ